MSTIQLFTICIYGSSYVERVSFTQVAMNLYFASMICHLLIRSTGRPLFSSTRFLLLVLLLLTSSSLLHSSSHNNRILQLKLSFSLRIEWGDCNGAIWTRMVWAAGGFATHDSYCNTQCTERTTIYYRPIWNAALPNNDISKNSPLIWRHRGKTGLIVIVIFL